MSGDVEAARAALLAVGAFEAAIRAEAGTLPASGDVDAARVCPTCGCSETLLQHRIRAEAGALDVERLATAIADHHDICSRMAIPECAPDIAAEYARLAGADRG